MMHPDSFDGFPLPRNLPMLWLGNETDLTTHSLGHLALIRPILDRLDLVPILDHHLPTDPQREYSHGQVLATLLAARLDQPLALMNVAAWARESGAPLLFGIPPEKLNDDRLGRALDAFFTARHSITAQVAYQAMRWTEQTPQRLHFDPTDITFFGQYPSSMERPTFQDPFPQNEDLPPAHLVRGYARGERCVQLGITAIVDDFGALPIACHCYDGNRNGHTGIRQQLQLLRLHDLLLPQTLIVSDRGTFSAEHLATLQTYEQSALCAVPWKDFRALYDQHRDHLRWQRASYLSQEQQRRRQSPSALPHDEYRLAVLSHQLLHPESKTTIDCRVIFVHSSSGEREERSRREQNIQRIRIGLEQIASKLRRAHPASTPESIHRQIVRLMGQRDAAGFFHWQVVALSEAEIEQQPAGGKGFKRPSHRLEWSLDQVAAETASQYDGLSILLTTAACTESADALFSQYKQQSHLERLHHQLKTPLAVSPVFLKTPRRVEALIHLLHLGLMAQQAAQRVYRQRESSDRKQDRTTADRLWRAFRCCSVVLEQKPIGTVVHSVRLSEEQRKILRVLGLAGPRQTLRTYLPPNPSG
jgi:hypothetical protein